MNHGSKAFTIIELLVSVSIVALIMSTVIYNYSAFNDALALSAGIEEMASATRQAQTYGLSVKESIAGSGLFNAPYGIYFDTSDPTHYYLFVDKYPVAGGSGPAGNGKYDALSGCGSGNTECVEKNTLRDGVVISSVCDASVCPPAGATSLQVTYLRPNPDGRISFTDSAGNSVGSSLTGKIILRSPKGKTGTVTIESTGQISVQ